MAKQGVTAQRATQALEILRDEVCDDQGQWRGSKLTLGNRIGLLMGCTDETGRKYAVLLEHLGAIQFERVDERERHVGTIQGVSYGLNLKLQWCLTILKPNARVVDAGRGFALFEE